MNAKKEITEDDFLDAHKLSDQVYVTGMFYSGITIYNQQVRTLNLIYYLIKKGVIKESKKGDQGRLIVVIGGGVAGVTATVALKILGYKVLLLEEKSLLLHLQHGCSTRQIHPHLNLWPREDSLKPFTELPFLNWSTMDASGVEKTLMSQFEEERNSKKNKGRIEVLYNVKEVKINLVKQKVTYTEELQKKETPQFSTVVLATGFGLEKYVGKKEKTKSYWRNDDLSQLRLKDQMKQFFISGIGDGGISDACRLSLIAFDPLDWAKRFENIQSNGKHLIEELRNIEIKSRDIDSFAYADDFDKIYSQFETEIRENIGKYKRNDISKVVINANADTFDEALCRGKMSFINAWIVFVLEKNNCVEYHPGRFPDRCGNFLFDGNEDAMGKEDVYYTIVRHGTDKNLDHFKKLNSSFEQKLSEIEKKQKEREINDFSTRNHWELQFWIDKAHNNYSALKYIVSNKLIDFCHVFLKTLEGITSKFIQENKIKKCYYRITLHRLVCYSDKYYFQQASYYVGNRVSPSFADIGRAFPIDEGIVGLAMRSDRCYTLVGKEGENGELFNYAKIFARPLPKDVKSFFAIPITTNIRKGSVLCLYMDSTDTELVENQKYRRLVYWTLTEFLKLIETKNVSEIEVDKSKFEGTIYSKEKIPGLEWHDDEISSFISHEELIMKTNKLIDVYDK